SDLDWSGFDFDFGGFDFRSPFGRFDLPRVSSGSSTPKSTTIQLDEKTSETFFDKLDELINRIVDAIREVTSRFAFEIRGIVGNIEDLSTQSMIPVAIEDVDPNVSVNDVVPDGGYRVANILLQLDGRIIARAIGQPLVDEIVIRGGI